jgi:lysophospholipase L1-like esterase
MTEEIAWLTLGLLLSVAVPVLAEDAPSVRIMPVGDSITRGSYLVPIGMPNPRGGGWRKALQDRLRAAGVRFEFCGELDYMAYGKDGVVDPDFSPRHHGLAGFGNHGIRVGGPVPTTPDVLAAKGVKELVVPGIVEALKRNRPDILLLMSGANGFDSKERELLVREICANFKGELFVSTITPQKPPRAGWEQVKAYNAPLPALIEAMKKEGAHVHYVDMFAALTPEDISEDGVHPNAGGMEKMGNAWFAALQTVLTADDGSRPRWRVGRMERSETARSGEQVTR